MATMALSGGFYNHDNPTQSPPKPASPASPSTSQFTAQQASRSFMNLNPTVRGQNPPFPTTPASAVLLEPPPGIQYMDFIRTWSDTHVSRWLTDIKCGSHAPAFKANDIRGDVLLELDQQTLKEMGVTSIGDRLRIVNAVKALRLKSSSRSSTSQTARSRLESGNEARTPLHDKGTTDRTDTAPNRPANRNARPAPLQLNQNAGRSDLPRLEHDSANRPNPTGRPNLPPLPPLPQGKPPPPPARQPARPSGAQGLSGRRTPTQDPTTYGTALPTAPQNRDLLTPSSATNWTGYHLPADPRPGNLGGKPPPPRSTSPLPPGRSRSGLPVGASPPNKLLPRPSAGTNPHPYATQSTPTLQNNLSPISESFTSNSGNPSPSLAYTVGRGAFNNSNAPQGTVPLETLRRKLVKFVLPDEGLTSTIDAATCAGGVEVLEKVLKKFGKGGLRSTDSDIEDGGLSIDGWAVYLSKGQDNNPDMRNAGTPLTEAELLSICHAPPENPWREHGLIVRRLPKVKRHDDRGAMSSSTSRATKRASSISILSGLGVRDPERALDPPSPTSAALSPAAHHAAKRPSKLRNFFGQRPPSELITNHLTEFFPAIEKKVLERTARHSLMLRSSTFSSKRDSVMSIAAGSHEEIPRMSLSTDDGRSIDLYSQDAGASTTTASPPQLLPPIPFPTESFSDSFDNITGRNVSRTASNASRRMSYMTELRSKRDRSDTASLMTVDEITAEVESRRASMQVDPGSDTDDWTKVDSDGLESSTLADQDLPKEVAPAGVEVDENEDEDSDNEGPEAMTSQGGKTSFFRTNISAFDLLIGNKWIKGALIGAGSFGKVYLGMDASTGLLMAVKQVELPTGSGPNQERKKSMLSALEREIELLKNLQHANIVQYLYSSIDDEYLNIFLEYVPGGSVTALIRNYGAFEEPLVKNFVRQILEGLNYLHERDIIHRDIKGANILVDNKGGIKISDFGISKKVDDNLLTGNRVNRPSLQGSVFWMAPEVVKQSAHTQKADIWSVGCLVVEMLTGEHPWAQLTQMQAIFKIGSSAKPSIPSDISAEAQEFLRLTFELDHEARPSAAELLQHLWISKKSKGGKNATSFESA
ncbi:Protein kinase byr2 [Termitomyces sp. J132]|nr:Protein kinase byr2 [Termitomyces sp. J132]